MVQVETGPGWELRSGRWQDALTGVEADALIVDIPYSDRVSHGQAKSRSDSSEARSLGYAPRSAVDLEEREGLLALLRGELR